MQFITLADYLLLPIYLLVVYGIAYSFRNRKYPVGHPWRPYFIPGLTVKIGGAVFIGLIYQYYYGGGDTVHYFNQGKMINSAFMESPVKWFNLVLHLPDWYDPDYSEYISQLFFYSTTNNYMVAAITAVVNIFTFNSYLPSSVLFAGIAFTGMWAIFRTFATQYPALVKYVAMAVLFVPSTFIWGSGIFKDTLCMFSLGWMIYGSFRMLVQREFVPMSIALAILGFYVVAVIKVYILLAFLPALGLWILFSYSHKIRSAFVRFFLKVSIAGTAVASFLAFSGSFAEDLGKYSLDNLAKTSTITREYIVSISEEGSSYNLGEFDPSITGMLEKFPSAVNVSLFRPYLWEARKPIVFFNALEAFLFLFVTLKILITIGPIRTWRTINSDPNIQFFLIFSLIFAFSVGISSGNFGALSRYRIPCLPMYGMALVLIYYRYRDPERHILAVGK